MTEKVATKLVLIRGLPGSGKSTLGRSMAGFVHVEADMYFDWCDGVYRFDPSKVKDAHAWCQNAARAALLTRRNVVVSNTFTRKWEMEPYLNMAKELGVEVEIIVAKGEYPNIHGVPEETIARMRERWED